VIKRLIILMVILLFVSITTFSIDIDYWSMHGSYGTGPTAKGMLSIYTNPSALVLQRRWEANFLSTVWENENGNAYRLFGANVIQPLENGFAGSLDLLYGVMTDPVEEDRYASFGYSAAGRKNRLGWGVRLLAGRFDKKEGDDSFFGSANFGLLYTLGTGTHMMLNANAPQIVTNDASVFEKNRPESFWAGGGILSENEQARAYISGQGYRENENPLFGANFGGGFKIGFFNWDASVSISDIGKDINIETMNTFLNGMVSFDFEDFSVALSGSLPVSGGGIDETKYSLTVSARW